MILSEYDYVIHHRPGSLSGKPDALSRRPEYELSPGEPAWVQQNRALLRPEQFQQGPVVLFAARALASDDAREAAEQPVDLDDVIRQAQHDDEFCQRQLTQPQLPFRVRDGILFRNDAA